MHTPSAHATKTSCSLASWELGELALGSTTCTGRVNLGRGTGALVDALVLLAHFLAHAARGVDGRFVAEVGIDANDVGSHAVDFLQQ